MHKKEWTLAVDEYMVALEHATSTLKADVLYNLGYRVHHNQRRRRRVRDRQRRSRAGIDVPVYLHSRGVRRRFAQEMLGREEEALASYQHAVSSMPTHLTALNGLGTKKHEPWPEKKVSLSLRGARLIVAAVLQATCCRNKAKWRRRTTIIRKYLASTRYIRRASTIKPWPINSR